MKSELFISWRYLGRTGRERFFALLGLPLFVIATGYIGFIVYLIIRKKERFISLFSISIVGIALGVMALITVIAVMSGFDRDLRDKIVGNFSHVTVASYTGIDAEKYRDTAEIIWRNPHVRGMSPFVQGQILIRAGNRFIAVGLKGIDPKLDTQTTKIRQYLVKGSLDDLSHGNIFVGKELAFNLGLQMGSPVTIFSPAGKEYNLKVAGIFYSGMYDYDLNLVFMNIKTAQEVLGLGDQITAVALKLDNLYLADQVKKELSASLGFDYNLRTWMEANQNFFAALKLEKLTMFIILTFIILVASFNIISTLIVLVVDKTKDIGILKSFGMTPLRVKTIFIFEGLIVGGMGTLLGAAGGVGLCLLLKKYQFVKLPQDIYYIDRLPVSLQLWPDITLIIAAAMLITLVSTIYPASKAAGLKPVDALRYE